LKKTQTKEPKGPPKAQGSLKSKAKKKPSKKLTQMITHEQQFISTDGLLLWVKWIDRKKNGWLLCPYSFSEFPCSDWSFISTNFKAE
jgi:hypothetical protein